jgi:hypothetical protein
VSLLWSEFRLNHLQQTIQKVNLNLSPLFWQRLLTLFSMPENQPSTTNGCLVHANHGGRVAQLQEMSDLLCQGLAKKIAGVSGKRVHKQLDDAPDNLPESDMAPPTKMKHQHVNKVMCL